MIRAWSASTAVAGCLLLGYEAFRSLVGYHNSKKSLQTYQPNELNKIQETVRGCLLDPGADLVICDEGHMIKNQKSTTSLAVNQIKTRRRVILTGTPIQNNLKECECHCENMNEGYANAFLISRLRYGEFHQAVFPRNGEGVRQSLCKSNKSRSAQGFVAARHRGHEAAVVRAAQSTVEICSSERLLDHILYYPLFPSMANSKMSYFQRREAALLKTFLPDKYEYVLFIPMTDVQV